MLPTDDDFWEDLVALVEEGRVIPVVGQRAVTFGDSDSPLYPWLALRLAERLQVERAKLSETPTLNEVVCRHLLSGGARNVIYTRLHRILRDECPAPGATLQELAAIPAFNLLVTTAFDPLLEQALNAARYGGKQLTHVCRFFPESAEDLPTRKRDLSRATVYHLLGRISPDPQYVVWEEDTLEFMCALNQRLETVMEKLARDLKEHGLLILGLNFSDWLVRFFLRIAKQGRLSESRPQTEYLAEDPTGEAADSMVMFFGGLSRNIQVVNCDPTEFIAELARRWREKHPPNEPVEAAFVAPPESEMPAGAIFISYAREDETAVIRLKAGLERHGCVCWYDRERLKPGGNWHNELEDAVKKRCALFLSVVSQTTENAAEGYFHQERNWAAERKGVFSDDEEFYIPVVIDDSPLGTRREPRVFRQIQATRLVDGEVTAEFGEHLRLLQDKRQSLAATA